MFTIGTFARLGHISTRMLRHYDRLGLLHPARVEASSGYRYYDASQLARLFQIERFKRYGFRLQQIKQLLELPPDARAAMIMARRSKLVRELEEMRGVLKRLENELLQMEDGVMENTNMDKQENDRQITFELMPFTEFEQHKEALFAILAANMSLIAPTGNTYAEDYHIWQESARDYLQDHRRKLFLIRYAGVLIGYFMYSVQRGGHSFSAGGISTGGAI